MTIAAKNPIHSVAFPTLVSRNATGLLVLLGIEFLALMLIIIYVGAIAVPSSSVAMMSNTKANESRENRLRYLPIGGLISIILLSEIFFIFDSDFIPFPVFDGSAGPSAFGGGSGKASSVEQALKTALQSLYNDFFYYQGQKP
jgi:hypothetical protein